MPSDLKLIQGGQGTILPSVDPEADELRSHMLLGDQPPKWRHCDIGWYFPYHPMVTEYLLVDLNEFAAQRRSVRAFDSRHLWEFVRFLSETIVLRGFARDPWWFAPLINNELDPVAMIGDEAAVKLLQADRDDLKAALRRHKKVGGEVDEVAVATLSERFTRYWAILWKRSKDPAPLCVQLPGIRGVMQGGRLG